MALLIARDTHADDALYGHAIVYTHTPGTPRTRRDLARVIAYLRRITDASDLTAWIDTPDRASVRHTRRWIAAIIADPDRTLDDLDAHSLTTMRVLLLDRGEAKAISRPYPPDAA